MKTRLSAFVNIPIWSGSLAAAFIKIKQIIAAGRHCHIVTLNAEMLLLMRESEQARAAILGADFFICDSFAVWIWLKMHHKNPARITGIDCAEYLIQKIFEQNETIAIFGGKTPNSSQRAAQFWIKQRVAIAVHAQGPKIIPYEKMAVDDADLVQRLKITKPKLICVGFGHGKQEWWISRIKKEIATPTIFIGVGGALDVWSGEVSRAPAFLRLLGLEWLWRLIQEPGRIKRIFQAVFIFPAQALADFLI